MALGTLELTPTEPAPLRGPKKRRTSLGGVLIWLVLTLLIIAPVLCFLLLAVSPRMFSQGSQWFTLTFIRQAFEGYSGRAIFNSFWVATVVSVFAVAIATTIAWLVHRTNVFGRRFWIIAMWLLLMMPTWMMTLGWTDLLQSFGAASALRINTHFVYGEFFGPTGIV